MKKFFTESHTIFHGDVLESLGALADGSVDLIFADPPYNIGKNFDGLRDKREEADYLDWCKMWLGECRRVLSPTGSLYLMCSTQMLAPLDLYCRDRFNILSRIVWTYDSSGVQAQKYFGSTWEPIIHMVADKAAYTFNADDILVEAKTGSKRNLIDYRKDPPQPYNTEKVPGNTWDFSRVRFRMDEYENHPSQKPEALLERIVRASSDRGDVVLDPFSGTFTTGAVAARLGRNTIGIEINETYVKIGLRRIGIPSDYTEADLFKIKLRKTKNKSKSDRTGGDLKGEKQRKLL